ncbi:LOW QUALITY PROTEIN: uncharacterized protein LOC143342844 [Colletes latitarsis]|uniref:LOW QUALITY PROTEIN: uncharacterized protein LOC143342844 n=1 Tax=Colletes latitarsis TaxID=2605962 RepID=UPI004035DB11
MERWVGKTAIVTGAASGIEEAITATLLGGKKVNVLALDIQAEKLQLAKSDRTAFERLLNINIIATVVFINRAAHSIRQRNVEGYIFNINRTNLHNLHKQQTRHKILRANDY